MKKVSRTIGNVVIGICLVDRMIFKKVSESLLVSEENAILLQFQSAAALSSFAGVEYDHVIDKRMFVHAQV